MKGMRYLSRSVSAASEPAHAFHADVQQRQIGPVLARQQDGVVAVVGVDHPGSQPGPGRTSTWPAPAGRRPPRGSCPLAVAHRRVSLAIGIDADCPRICAASCASCGVEPRDAGRVSRTLVCTCRLLLDITSAALRRGSSAPHQAQPETPPGTRARLKPSGPAGIDDNDARPSSPQFSVHSTSPPPALCFTALVSSSLTVSAIGIDSASGSAQRCGASRRARSGCCGRRCAAPSRRSPRPRSDAQRPLAPTLQAVDLRDHCTWPITSRHHAGHLGLALGVCCNRPATPQVVLDAVVHFIPASRAARSPPRSAPPARRAAR